MLYLTYSIEQRYSWKPDSRLAGQKLSDFYRALRFIIAFIRSRHWFLFVTSWIQSTHYSKINSSVILYPHSQYVFIAWCLVKHRDNFTFTSHLRLGLASVLFPSDLTTIILNAFLVYPMYCTLYLSQPPWFDCPDNNRWSEVKWSVYVLRFLIVQFFYHIFISPWHYVREHPILRSSLRVRDQVSHQYKAKGKR
jgi:hypothetical protein